LKRLGLLVLLAAGAVCRTAPVRDEARLADLRRIHAELHQKLEPLVAADPLVREALQGQEGDLIVAVRWSLIQDVVREGARLYLDRVLLDLGDVEASAHGEIERKTLLGHMTVGSWRVRIVVQRLRVRLKALDPRLEAVRPNELKLRVPVEAMEAPGRVSLHFTWNSASLAKLVCRDFQVSRDLDGRTLRQQHTIGGTVRITAGPDSISVAPLVADEVVRLKVDLSPQSWGVVERTLRSQDSLMKCGLLLDPAKVLERLRQLASEGIKIHLPREMFRTQRFPADIRRTAQIDERPVTVAVRTRSFEATPRVMWSRAAVGIETGKPPAASARVEAPEASRDLDWPAH
jgi:hypothetical protein